MNFEKKMLKRMGSTELAKKDDDKAVTFYIKTL